MAYNPPVHLDPELVKAWSTAVVATGAAAFAIAKAARAIARGFWKAFRIAVAEANEPLDEKVTSLKEYTEYHLGPNGHTPPVHSRIQAIERLLPDQPDPPKTIA